MICFDLESSGSIKWKKVYWLTLENLLGIISSAFLFLCTNCQTIAINCKDNEYLLKVTHLPVNLLAYTANVSKCASVSSESCIPALTVGHIRDRGKRLSADPEWRTLPGQIPPQRLRGVLPPCCIHTLTIQLTGQCQGMPEIYGNYYLLSPRKRNGLMQPGYNMRSIFWIQAASEMFVQFPSRIFADRRQWEEPSGCQFLSFSKPTALMGCQCDPATLFALHDYCVELWT